MSEHGEEASKTELFDSRCGKRLLRRRWSPEASGYPTNGRGVLLLHGLGDHSGRYDDMAGIFVRQGFTVGSIDFPGNGRSSGKRGVMGGVEEAHQVMDECVDWLESDGLEVSGLVAHSMGGFLGLLYLLGRPGRFRFCWVNGALVDPGWGQNPILRLVARVLGTIIPDVTVGNGVRSSMCSHRVGERDPLTHRRVSIGLGGSLMAHRETLWNGIVDLDPEMMLLATHGGADPVCPAPLTRAVIERAGAERKRFVEFPGMLHETFRDDGAEALFETASAWLEEVVEEAGCGRSTRG